VGQQRFPGSLGMSEGVIFGMEQATHLKALSSVLEVLEPLEADSRRRVIDTVLTFFGDDARRATSTSTWDAIDATKIPNSHSASIPFSTNTDISPKDFLLQKSPKSDVERIACLGFYLTHFRSTPHFKTADLTKLNTEAAQPRLSNAAQAVANATKYSYLAPATKGNKQIGAQGEQFVLALPDRDAARAAMMNRPKRTKNRSKNKPIRLKSKATLLNTHAKP